MNVWYRTSLNFSKCTWQFEWFIFFSYAQNSSYKPQAWILKAKFGIPILVPGSKNRERVGLKDFYLKSRKLRKVKWLCLNNKFKYFKGPHRPRGGHFIPKSCQGGRASYEAVKINCFRVLRRSLDAKWHSGQRLGCRTHKILCRADCISKWFEWLKCESLWPVPP